MIWIIIVVIGLVILFQINKNAKEKNMEEDLINRIHDILFSNPLPEEIHKYSFDFLSYCLKKSNKNLSIEDITNKAKIFENPNLLHYATLFSSLKESLVKSSNKAKELSIMNKTQTASDTFNSMKDLVISEVNRIK